MDIKIQLLLPSRFIIPSSVLLPLSSVFFVSNFCSNAACARFPLAAADTRKKIANRRADLRTRTNSSFHLTSLPQIVSVVRPICGEGG